LRLNIPVRYQFIIAEPDKLGITNGRKRRF
jgi:hypothetical protein